MADHQMMASIDAIYAALQLPTNFRKMAVLWSVVACIIHEDPTSKRDLAHLGRAILRHCVDDDATEMHEGEFQAVLLKMHREISDP